MPELPEHPTMEFAEGVKFGTALVMEAQTRTIREVLIEVAEVPDEGQLPVGAVKEMLRSFARTNEEIVADIDQTLSNITGAPKDDPRDEGEGEDE